MNPKTIFFLTFFKNVLIFGCAGSSWLGSFLVAVSGGLLSTCGVRASHCSDFSCCRARGLAHGLRSPLDLEHRLNSRGPWA